MNRLVAIFFIFCLMLLSSCGKKSIEYGSFIQTRGNYELGEGASLEIFKDSNDLLNIRHTRSSGNVAEWVKGIVMDDSSWFIYVVNFDEMWLATENDLVLIYEGEKGSGSISIFSSNDPHTINKTTYGKIPQAVLQRIGSKLKSQIQEAQQ